MNLSKLLLAGSFATQGLLFSPLVDAENIDIQFINLTQGMHFTPVLFSVHDGATNLYALGAAASPEIQAMAEGGDISGLQAQVVAAGGSNIDDSAPGLLAPASSSEILGLDVDPDSYLSIATMLLPTNDAFTALNGWKIPSEPGTYTLYLNAYDAGTEANNELVLAGSGVPGNPGIPGAPGGDSGINGTGVTNDESNAMIHVHRGNVGDTEADGGVSDVDSRIHRWLNPVAQVTVTVN